jgi:Skp family chaperone for outer membrane proteins
MAKQSRLAGAPDWVRETAQTAAAVVRPGAALTAAAAAGAGVVLEGVSEALEAKSRKHEHSKAGMAAPLKLERPKRKKAAPKKAGARRPAASKKKAATKQKRAVKAKAKKRRAAGHGS